MASGKSRISDGLRAVTSSLQACTTLFASSGLLDHSKRGELEGAIRGMSEQQAGAEARDQDRQEDAQRVLSHGSVKAI